MIIMIYIWFNILFNNNNVEFTVLRLFSLENNPKQTRRQIIVNYGLQNTCIHCQID